jgi:adenosylcobinamide kinase/adenosylcobinamide-phosphate guanylyltransferase
MIILVRGANGSGKSASAERLIAGFGGKRYYIATMIPFGDEGFSRIDRHIKQRAGMGFITLELPYSFGGVEFPADCSVLLEDVSNLLANNIFEKRGGVATVFGDIAALCGRVKNAVLVTISEFDENGCDDCARAYIAAMHTLNARLAGLADEVVTL